jgi:hypothetical protein
MLRQLGIRANYLTCQVTYCPARWSGLTRRQEVVGIPAEWDRDDLLTVGRVEPVDRVATANRPDQSIRDDRSAGGAVVIGP